MLKKIRDLLADYECEWECPDLLNKWKGYFLSALLYSNKSEEDIYEEFADWLEERIAEDKELKEDDRKDNG